ncbi:MAG: hypothetical protein NVSMB13_00670 [Mycobacteriales bacterium]
MVAAAGDIACSGDPPLVAGGNNGTGGCRATSTADVLSALRPAVVLALGDEQYGAAGPAEFRAGYDASWGRVKEITRPAPGNHEYAAAGAGGYFGYFGDDAGPVGRGYYSFDVGSWHLVSLNSNCRPAGGCETGSPQERWLRADLAAHPSTCTLAFWHHPRFSSGLHGDDPTVGALWDALYDAGAELALAGHDHDYERWAPMSPAGTPDPDRGIREFVVGTGGRSLYPILGSARPSSQARSDEAYGVRALTLHPAGYDWSFPPRRRFVVHRQRQRLLPLMPPRRSPCSAEDARFELARGCPQHAFQACAIGQLGESSVVEDTGPVPPTANGAPPEWEGRRRRRAGRA